MESVNLPSSDSQAADTPIKMGDVTFTRERVVLSRDGQLITSVRRDSFETVEVGEDAAAARSSHGLILGVIFTAGGVLGVIFDLASPPVALESIAGSVLALFIGIVLILSGSGTMTVVRLRGPKGEVVLSTGRQFQEGEIASLRQRLIDELGYPNPPKPVPRGF